MLQGEAIGQTLGNLFFAFIFLEWHHSILKEYPHKDYLSLQKKGVGETNILQQTL